MIQIVFEFESQNIIIQGNVSDPFKKIINNFCQKISVDSNELELYVNGQIIDPEKTLDNYLIKSNEGIMKVIVNKKYKENNKDIIERSKDIICPQCKEPCRINMNNYKIKLYECSNGHINDEIKINDFLKTQDINISLIICDQCKIKNKGNTYNNEFYYCLNCKKNICVLCKSNHDSNHNIIKYEQKNYVCSKHYELYTKYCKQCNNNICYICEIEHKNHNIISLLDYRPDIEKTKKRLIEFKNVLNEFNKQIKDIQTKLNELIKSLNIFYDINNNIINNYNIKNRSYELYQNINEIINNNIIYEQLKNINNNNNFKNKINNIIDLYNNIINNDNYKSNKITNKSENKLENNILNKIPNELSNKISNENINEITIIYNINNQKKIKIFGSDFVKNNKNKCKIIYNNITKEISEYININDNEIKQQTIQIKLIDIQNVTNMSNMFSGCNALSSLPDISKWDTKNVTNMSYMFYGCNALKNIPNKFNK